MFAKTRAVAATALNAVVRAYIWTVDQIEKHPHVTFWAGVALVVLMARV